MKWVIRIGLPVLVFGGCVFGDIKLCQFLFAQLPDVASWLFWAKLGIVGGVIWATGGIVVLATTVSGILASAVTRRLELVNYRRK